MEQRNIYLVGPMGAGKTTIGRLLAAELHRSFADTDHVLEQRCGADIAWIFDVEGEQGFRVREAAVLAELAMGRGLVLATGGGIVLREDNRELLRASGFVVYLAASVAQQYRRAGRDRKRPLLQTSDPRAALERLFAERDPLYRSVADFVVATDERNPRLVARDIAAALADPFDAPGATD